MNSFPHFEPHTVGTALGDVSFTERGRGPAILFLHGLSGNCASFGLQLAGLGDSHRTVAWDAPGYGGTAPCASAAETTVEHYARRAIALLDALAIERAAVVGHSMGGVIAGALAATYPDRVNSLLLSCTHTGYAAAPGAPLAAGHQRRLEELSRVGAAAYGHARARDMLAATASEAIVETVAALASRTTRAGLESAIRAITTADTRADIATIGAPVAVVAGALDRIAPREKTDALAALLPGCRYEVIADCAHAPYIEQPEKFNRLVQELLKEA